MVLILDDTSEHDAHVSEKGNLIISRQLVTSTPTLKVDTSLGLRIRIGFTRIRIQHERKKTEPDPTLEKHLGFGSMM